jgi:hypothetical protein
MATLSYTAIEIQSAYIYISSRSPMRHTLLKRARKAFYILYSSLVVACLSKPHKAFYVNYLRILVK